MPPKKLTKVKTRKRVAKKVEYLPYINDVPKYKTPDELYAKAEIIITYVHAVNDIYGRPIYNSSKNCAYQS